MSALAWSDALELKQPRMDQTHREFVDMLQALDAAAGEPPQVLDGLLGAFVAHTEEHFAQEERWMAALGFQAGNCHDNQHGSVLEVLREARKQVAENARVDLIPILVEEIGRWFAWHAQMMDAALAETMVAAGYDAERECFASADTAARAPAGATPCAPCAPAAPAVAP